jgi:Fur family ferric uptake transcriptional regulator
MAVIRHTRQRAAIREAFEICDRPLSPDDVLAAARDHTEGLGIATVYRNIKALVEEGWLVAVELPGQSPRYELSGKGHHHHFQCNRCGQLFELHGCVESFRKMIPAGFQITAHEVLLYGTCRDCRGNSVKDRRRS